LSLYNELWTISKIFLAKLVKVLPLFPHFKVLFLANRDEYLIGN